MMLLFIGILTSISGGYSSGDPVFVALIQQPALTFLVLLGLIGGVLLVNKFAEPHVYTFQKANGSPAGEIRGKYYHSNWKIMDYSSETSTTLHLGRSGTGELDTPFGLFTVKMKRDVYDSSGNLCFSVHGYNYSFTIESKGVLNPNLPPWCQFVLSNAYYNFAQTDS